jgi:glycosyltransferase involved in cell wall biosynthesis
VTFRFNKGVFMPTFPAAAWQEICNHDVVNIHLPQVEAALATALTRLAGRKPILTYHCDLHMPPVWYGRLVDRLTLWDNLVAGALADTIVTYTEDFARHSPFLSRFGMADSASCGDSAICNLQSAIRKVRVILPPVVIPASTPEGVRALRDRVGLNGQKVIGFAARFAYEKGAGYLINAIPYILRDVPDVRILFAGPYGKEVIGETIWYDMQPLIKQYEPYLTFLGTLNPNQMADFFAACDVFTVASINSTESFGLVQVEAFMCGTPVVATDLPGVRQPVTMTGMGEIVPIADAEGLAAGIVKVLKDPAKYVKPHEEILRLFDLARTVDEYERLFEEKIPVRQDKRRR